VATAREHWKVAKAKGLSATYWQQNEQGRWEKRA
jgi:DNA polymerase-3 subunit chi